MNVVLALDQVGWDIAYAMQVLITEIARKRSKAERMVGEVLCGDEKKECDYPIRQNMFEHVEAVYLQWGWYCLLRWVGEDKNSRGKKVSRLSVI